MNTYIITYNFLKKIQLLVLIYASNWAHTCLKSFLNLRDNLGRDKMNKSKYFEQGSPGSGVNPRG